MKKLLGSVLAVLFLACVAAPVFAADAPNTATPTAKAMKHKAAKNHHKKAARKKKGAAKPSETPAPKK